jgi:hypothetical protein
MVGLGERRRQLQEFLARTIRPRKIWRRGSGRDLQGARADKVPRRTSEYFRDENKNVAHACMSRALGKQKALKPGRGYRALEQILKGLETES